MPQNHEGTADMADAASNAIRLVRGACPHDCPDTCAVITEVQDGRAIRFYADKEHPVTRGWLCAKVRPYLDRVYHPDRLTHPLRRVGPKGGGQWERITWDEAIAEIAERWKAIISEHGGAAILPYSYSGTLGLVNLGVSNARLWNRIGASGLIRSICDAAAKAAVDLTLGARRGQDPWQVRDSKLVLIWGHNPASTAPHFVPFLREAQRNGAHVVVIDPRRTLIAGSADEHIRPRPATDGALALGLMHVLFAENLHDEAWLRAHSVGWEDLRERAKGYPPARVAEITGVPAETIVSLARRYGTTKPALLKFADGIQRHGNGGQTVRALLCLPAVVGQYGIAGGGIAYSTSGWITWDDEAVGHGSDCSPTPRSVNMNRLGAALTGEVQDPPIQSLYVFAANPVAATPNSSRIIEGLKRADLFTVVHEQFMTDTADWADIVLPATSQLEQTDLHKPYGHRHLQYNQQAIPPLAEAKSNWDVMRLLAAAMGFTEPWLRQEPEEIIEEVLTATQRTTSLLDGITLEQLQRDGTAAYTLGPSDVVPFADRRFPTPSGKVELRSDGMVALGLDPLPAYEPPTELADHYAENRKPRTASRDGVSTPLVLISGASHHFVTTSMGNMPALEAKEGTPFLEINPGDAEARGIAHGDDVEVANGRGSVTLRAVVTGDAPPGVVIAPKGRWARRSPDRRNVNWLTSDALADLGGQATFHSNLVQIRPAEKAQVGLDRASELVTAD